MISISSAQLDSLLIAFLYPLTRILALVASAPVIGNKQVPARVKVGFAMLVTFVVAPALTIPSGIDMFSGTGLFILMQQLLVGFAMGFTMRLVFIAVETAGDLMGMQMGLGFASFYDPVNSTTTQVLAQFLGIVAALAFLALNGHLYMLETLAESFQTFPISTQPPAAGAMHTLVIWGGGIFSQALRLALPIIGALLITNLALGILTRSAPQLNIFAIGFPITLAVGFVTLLLTLPYLSPMMDMFTQEATKMMLKIASQLGGH